MARTTAIEDARDAIAMAFVAARREKRGLAEYPGTAPATLDEAYAIQARAIGFQDSAIGGWKVGRIAEPLIARFGANRLAGPIFAGGIVDATSDTAMPVFADGFAAAEAEFLLRIGTAPDPSRRYTLEDAAACIDAVHIGIEVASSPYPGINADGPAVTVSDFGNNEGLVVGEAVAGWRGGGFLDWPIELRIDGRIAGQGIAADMLDGPFGAAAFLFNLAAERGFALRPGQWISSGAVTGVHEVVPGQTAIARFGEDRFVKCAIRRAG